MTYLEEFLGSISSLPADLQKNYTLLRQLDERQQDLAKAMNLSKTHGLEDILQLIKSGNGSPTTLTNKYCSEIDTAHKTCLDVANEKVNLAVQSYNLVDTHVQCLDDYLKRLKEEYEQGSDHLSEDSILEKKGGASCSSREGDATRSHRKRGQASVQQTLNAEIDLPIDPNEPTYCYCNQVSFGNMIACDNPECKIEWFHFDCVGIKEHPKGKWYCNECAMYMKRRKGK